MAEPSTPQEVVEDAACYTCVEPVAPAVDIYMLLLWINGN